MGIESQEVTTAPDQNDISRRSTVDVVAPEFSTVELLQQGFSQALHNVENISVETLFRMLPSKDVEDLLTEEKKFTGENKFKVTYYQEGKYFMVSLRDNGVDYKAWGEDPYRFQLRPYIQAVIDTKNMPVVNGVQDLRQGWNLVLVKGSCPNVTLYFKV